MASRFRPTHGRARVSELRRIVITWMATARGGAEQSSLDLCAALARRYQLDVTLLLWRHNTEFPITDSADFQLRVCAGGESYRRTLAGLLTDEPGHTALFSNHRAFQIDLPLAAQAGVPCGVIFRESPLPEEALRTIAAPDASALVYRRGPELDWARLAQAAALIGVSDFCARQIRQYAPAHTAVIRIYNGIAGTPPLAPPPAPPCRRFVIVSRLIGWKAVDFGIAAFARLWRRYPDARLQIAGEGEEEPRLRGLAAGLLPEGVVSFLGFRTGIDSVFAGNDFLLHLSPIESFGRVIAEAGLHGLPAIAPQSAGAGELIIDGHTGLTFRPGDADDCLRILASACEMSADIHQQLAQNAARRARALFNLDRAVEEYAGLASAMLHERAGSGGQRYRHFTPPQS
ncbi:MAG: glycosyltransferase family 4 protein [Blastocatellia bacterium]